MRNPNNPSGWDDTVAVDEVDTAPLELQPAAPPAAPVWAVGEAKPYPSAHLPWWRWIAGGLRAGVFLSPETGRAQPTPWQVLLLTLACSGLLLGLARCEVVGPAQFDWRAWLVPWCLTLGVVWAGWFALPHGIPEDEELDPWQLRGLGAWFALTTVLALPAQLALQLLGIAVSRGWLAFESDAAQWLYWVLYFGLIAWMLAALVNLTARFDGPRWRLLAFAAVLFGLSALAVLQFPDRPWVAETDDTAAEEPEPPRLHLSQEVFEAQQNLWPALAANLQARRDGVVNVYGLVFAPYADEDVFRRESTLVADVLRQRFDADGRVIQLLNHPDTGRSVPWATPQNLHRAIDLLAGRMDRDHDLLVVYLTSHGAQDFQLAASNWPLDVDPIDPALLRRELDGAGIRNRVIAISACFSGGWIEPLANDDTLVMTAADADHTSYGCGSRSELTFFGRAMFDEQLRQTHSFTQAFARALPVIAQREKEAGKEDGPSNPQMRLGAHLQPVLDELARRLDRP